MKQELNKKVLFLSLLGVFFAGTAKAFCPVCVVAVGAGLGLSRWLGVDDIISGLWIGALIVSLINWTITEFKKHNWNFKFSGLVITLAYYLLIFAPLYYAGIIGHPLNRLWGIDKLVLGTAAGSIIFWASHYLYLYLKKQNGGKPHFSYEKVVLPVFILALASFGFYLMIK